MIARLRGQLLDKRPPTVVVEAAGVGYEVDTPLSTLEALPEIGAEVTLHTHLSVRDDGHALFGFRSRSERDLFRRLIRVSGVGPKLALALLSGVDGEELVRCVRDDDPKRLTQVPGVGCKTAERLVVELRDRLEQELAVLPGKPAAPAEGEAAPAGGDALEEAVEGLVALGYKQPEAARMARAVAEPGLGCEALIRRALQRAAPRGG